ncbi:hypothetical protein [Streptomyces mutabilis]|uniref:hypothetical protein n=1 Tax=Streptomyces mutabilis TaxID=67332 RepID=UPI0036ACE5AE
MSTTEPKTRARSPGMSQDKLAWDALQDSHAEARLGPNGPLMPKLLAELLAAALPLVKAGHPMRIREAPGCRMTLHPDARSPDAERR